MISLVQFNTLLALGTIVMQVAIVVGIILLFFQQRSGVRPIMNTVARFAIPISFFLALIGSALTLFYSEIIGYAPCSLCWFQRIFLYPQVIILGIAWWKHNTDIARYIIALSAFGLAFALYQYYMQMAGGAGLPCPAGDVATDCGRRYIFAFGYVTFPLMAATTFAANAILMAFLKYRT